MNATDPSLANIFQTQGNLEHYHVPKYQREYTWSKNETEQLLNDIEENEPGYFMGSIICIDDNPGLGPGESRIFEVVDGQQRLTTLSLLLMAIYKALLEIEDNTEELDEEEVDDFRLRLSNIRKQIIHKKTKVNKTEDGWFKDGDRYCFLRVQPSTQKSNYEDYVSIIADLGLLKGKYKSNFKGLRRLSRAYQHFYESVPDNLEELTVLLHKINSLKFIHISVTSSTDAFTLFESLNNRGVPLSIMDIMKNKILASLEKQGKMKIDEAYDEWQELLKLIPEYKDQERFLRHYYNAFKVFSDIKIDKYTRATRSNLIKIFETFIKKDSKSIFDDLQEKAELYSMFINPEDVEDEIISTHLLDLKRIGSAPSYLLLLYLFNLNKENYSNKKDTLENVLAFLVKYYVRRNITDFPNTRNLDAINIDIIEQCEEHISNEGKISDTFIINILLKGKGKPSDISKLKDDLADNLYYYNSGMARFVLAKIDEITHSREYKPELWQRNPKGLLVWTIEHIFPQGNKIPDDWIDMIADGDKEEAKKIQSEWVHCLGNLTLSGYNSQLSNASFDIKQDLHKNKKFLGYKINIGYKNGLSLNQLEFNYKKNKTSLSNIEVWNKGSIKNRNKVMVNTLLKIYAFNEEELKEIKK